MEKSESIKEIGIALAKFQSEVHNPSNTATNPFFKSKYAPLAEVLNTIRPTLSKNGLSVIQNNYGNGEGVTVTTTLIHSSGEWLTTGEITAKPEKNTAQAMGAIITYLRRYQLSSLLGVSSEDDNDGNETKQDDKKTTTKKDETPKPKVKPLTKEQREKTIDVIKKQDFTVQDGILNTYNVLGLIHLTDDNLKDIAHKKPEWFKKESK